MGTFADALDEKQQAWIRQQPMFFVATAPNDGHINVSPKGYDSLRIVDNATIAYLDLTGSGAETIAHVNENQRITFMWCALQGKPLIVRAYGRATVFTPDSAGYKKRVPLFEDLQGARAIIEAQLDRVSNSCGWGIPEFTLEGQRPTLQDWAQRKGPDGIAKYQAEKNRLSIDGIPTQLG